MSDSPTNFKFAALLSYRGTAFCGWQRQSGSAAEGHPSVQGTIEAALAKMTNESPSVVGSGRTDSGVHALGQVAHFRLESPRWEAPILLNGLNSLLPQTIRVLAMKPVPMEFHAQRSAVKKQYSYYFQQGPAALPHLEPISWWIRKRLDLEAINQALSALIGEHDFKAFQAAGAATGTTVRKILEAEALFEPLFTPGSTPIAGQLVGCVRVRLVGTGFLKQMVRGIAGTLLEIGEGRRPASDMAAVLAAKSRDGVGPTAPGRALWLERVWYPGFEW